ncbi:MAG: hypothetical protein JJE23_03315 [Thermoleophilia bacterium]|nr:hypothetical protein [Thermoleophilia bacterium]
MLRTLEVGFDASGAADAGARGRVVCVVDVVDAATSAEAGLAAGAVAVLGAAPAGVSVPVDVDPADVGARAAALARESGGSVVVVAEPRVGPAEERIAAARPVLDSLAAAGVSSELVANQGAELPALAELSGRIVVVVSATGGVAYDAALAAAAPAACFATTARVVGSTGWEVAALGARRAAALAREHEVGLSVIAASANSSDDCLGAFDLAQTLIREGHLRGQGPPEGGARRRTGQVA